MSVTDYDGELVAALSCASARERLDRVVAVIRARCAEGIARIEPTAEGIAATYAFDEEYARYGSYDDAFETAKLRRHLLALRCRGAQFDLERALECAKESVAEFVELEDRETA